MRLKILRFLLLLNSSSMTVVCSDTATFTGHKLTSSQPSLEGRQPPVDVMKRNIGRDERRASSHKGHDGNRRPAPLAFSRSVYAFDVREDTLPGTVVGTVETLSKDGWPFLYVLVEDDGDGLFLLGQHSGEFSLTRTLDYESEQYYMLTVRLQNANGPSVRVYFNVLDINDNPPIIWPDYYSCSAPEDTDVGTCILSLNASDVDSGMNAELNWAITEGNEDAKFNVNSKGFLCLQAKLDRENVSLYVLKVSVNNVHSPTDSWLTSTALVTVHVEDVNDNAPVFHSPRTIHVSEDTPANRAVMDIQAVDVDLGSNGQIIYELENISDSRFRISRSGRLYLKEVLDREEVDSIVIQVKARDQGSPEMLTAMNLTIIVEDINDNDPHFSQDVYSISVREDLPRGTSLLQVAAYDADVGLNGAVRYEHSRDVFLVDPVTGIVSLRDSLDRERTTLHLVVVVAVDQGDTKRSATAFIEVTVADVNDCAPVLSPQLAILHLLENREDVPSVIHQAFATDEDIGMNSQVFFNIEWGDKEDIFSLSLNGTLSVLQSLDREEKDHYWLYIIAVDSGIPPLTGTGTIFIQVDDLNDNRPTFIEDYIVTSVNENCPVGTIFATLQAIDFDYSTNGEVRYFLEDKNVPFYINHSGVLFTTGVLDRETLDSYTLIIKASDQNHTHTLSSSATVLVQVADVNDNWPRFFSGPYVANIPTSVSQGTIVFAVSAVDEDAGSNAELIFSLFGLHADKFSINSTTGSIFANVSLNGRKDVILNVLVEDGGVDSKFDRTTVTFRFQRGWEFPNVSVAIMGSWFYEDEALGSLVAVVTGEAFRQGPLSYYLAGENLKNTFHLDHQRGELTIKNPLDYEANREFRICIESRDAGFPPFSTYTEFPVRIVDVNDNVPVFIQNVYKCEVFENLLPTEVCKVLAIDADTGIYGQVEYSIVKGNENKLFVVETNSGILKTIKKLDRENKSLYTLAIQATDKGNSQHTATAVVLVSVLDVNDNAPRFSQIFFTEISEDSPRGFAVLKVTTSDEDIGNNAVITYSIVNQQAAGDTFPFVIDKTSGSITVIGPLDRETQDRYVITVNANDSDWSVNTDVTVDVIDANDNPPVFSESHYYVTVPETKAKNVFVMRVMATDADTGDNGHILYYIEPSSAMFGLNASTGDILTKQPVLLDAPGSYNVSFTVVALDCGTDPQHSKATVTVTFVPYNHFPPVFLPYRPMIYIPYNLANGTVLMQLSAVDQDDLFRATPVEYMISGGNGASFFYLDSPSGQVWLKRPLSQTFNTLLSLLVTAKDNGSPPLTSDTTVHFFVTDQNRFAPHFVEPVLTLSFPEDLPIGFVIGQVQAEDEDDGINGVLSYLFDSKDEESPFAVDGNTGLITLVKLLDFETKDVHRLQMFAIDGGWIPKIAEVTITVYVEDVNDNPPTFPAEEYTVFLSENSPAGTVVFQATATDKDTGTNAHILYSLITGDSDLFFIDLKNGTITTREVFDFEVEQFFQLAVKASDKKNSHYFCVTRVKIQIIGLNEFTPKFRKARYNFQISEKSPIGTRVGTVLAEDYDVGVDGEVFYFLVGQSKKAGFSVDEDSGEIITSSHLQHLGKHQVVFHIIAKNRGNINGKNIAETVIQINVLDANDPPRFISDFYTTELSEDVTVGTSIMQVSAEDLDSTPEWSHFFYSFESGNQNRAFTIDPLTGIIYVNNLLDRERWPSYNMTVIAVDWAVPSETGSTNVAVVILDVNDNPPSLSSTEVRVLENQPNGTVVTVLNASDPDLPPNQGPFIYRLGQPGNGFSLTANGVLSTTAPVDRESNPEFSVPVVVEDSGTPSLSSTAVVHVRVADENDNPSAARIIYIEVKYYGNIFPGGFIGNVHPEDPDELDVFNCSIKSGPKNMFSFPFGNCDLWSSSYQGEATYNITIEANDNMHSSVNNSIYVNYKGFTNRSVENSFLFYVDSSSFREFLSMKYLKFVKALDSLFNLQASKTHVFGVKTVENEIILLAAVKSYNGQYLSAGVASSISTAQKKLLEAQSGVQIGHISSNPCFMTPCQNGGICSKNIYISQEFGVLESPSVIFVSPKHIELFNCSCLDGYTGTRCEFDIDECEKELCKNGGTCTNYIGGFSCQCSKGFTGKYCSLDVDVCQSMPCQNGGVCININGMIHCGCLFGFEGYFCERIVDHCASLPCVKGTCINVLTGYNCICPFGISGDNCEEESYGFEELSYMEFAPLDPRNNIISLEMASVQPNSLLLYNHGGLPSAEFMALEIIGGKVQLSFDLGQGVVKLTTQKKVADGLFHVINVRRMGKVAFLQVDNCPDNEPSVCFTQTQVNGSARTLDVGSNNLTVGGIKSMDAIMSRPNQVQTHDFVGCLRNTKINGIPLDFSQTLDSYNVLDSCPRSVPSLCNKSLCLNGGVCRDYWTHYSCHCKELFTGPTCEKEMSEHHALRLTSHDHIEYVIKESYKRDQQLTRLFDKSNENAAQRAEVSVIEIKLKTTKSDGAVLSFWGKEGFASLMLKDGTLQFLSGDNASTGPIDNSVKPLMLDGHWHVLHIFINGSTAIFKVDNLPIMNTTTDIAYIDRILLGGGLEANNGVGFSGCIQYLRYSGHILPFSGFSEVVESYPSTVFPNNGCLSTDVCDAPRCLEEETASCRSLFCLNEGICSDSYTGNTSCVCLENTTGSTCKFCYTHQICPTQDTSPPFWIVGVILPVGLIVTTIVLLVILRRHGDKPYSTILCRSCKFPKRAKNGRVNEAFHCENGSVTIMETFVREPIQPNFITSEKEGCLPTALVPQSCSEGQQHPLDESLGSSDLQYYDIDNTSSILQCPLYDTPSMTVDQNSRKDKASKKNNILSHAKAPSKTKSESQHLQEVCRGLRLQSLDGKGTTNTGNFHITSAKVEVLNQQEPPLALSVDELKRLSVSLDQLPYAHEHETEWLPYHTNSCSSDSETYSGFTSSDYKNEKEVSVRKEAALSFRHRGDHSPRSAVRPLELQSCVDCTSTNADQRWESILNWDLHFEYYAHVFEDIAALPWDRDHEHDIQSEEEEII